MPVANANQLVDDILSRGGLDVRRGGSSWREARLTRWQALFLAGLAERAGYRTRHVVHGPGWVLTERRPGYAKLVRYYGREREEGERDA